MNVKFSILTAAVLSGLFNGQSFADQMEIITIEHIDNYAVASASDKALAAKIDVSDLFKVLPGASINGNGPLTGIVQYRGLSGDRVNTQINGAKLAGAGPNAMDTPLSYASLIMTERVDLYRGIAPVASGIDTLGGTVNVVESSAEFDVVNGKAAGQYQDNGQRGYLGAKANLANKDHALLVYADALNGNEDVKTASGKRIHPTDYKKQMLGGQYKFNLSDSASQDAFIGVGYQHLETTDAGTPALPMDIDFIRTDRVNVEGLQQLADWQLDWHLAYSDARHGMDNFSQRKLMPTMGARYNNADSTSFDGAVALSKDNWQLGVDVQMANHDSVITNPTQAMFSVDNFNDVEDNRYSAFAQWDQKINHWQVSLGARVKQYQANAGDVHHSMAANMPAINMLMTQFNQADKSQSQTGFDAVVDARYEVNNELSWIVGLARKQSSASYQQRYLWVPMQSTGGLADGKTYVGQIDLDLETAYQIELGSEYRCEGLSILPRIFYHSIDDYIQGVSATSSTVIMAGAMVGDNQPMQFANVDADLMGMDINAAYAFNSLFSIDMVASYVAGERRDIDDNLYRIAPANINVGLNYESHSWFARLETLAVAAQNKVSQSQLEQRTSGYAVVNMLMGYEAQSWLIKAGVNNVFDIEYQDHLAGYNRVMASEISPGERMPGLGMQAWLAGEYRF
ncbi:TonB-dependent receptor plug domain-containing protein [Shewanella sp. HL-SH4]|uniref:TonB-dependent receptor plug domain-containing protein n=1 Tax=Shewanella sp. HL-SH4 TaxID=3436240 RepID=UPI003EBE7038